MKQPGLILLCARNSRSSAYVQALVHARIEPEAIIIYGNTQPAMYSERIVRPETNETGLFMPDVTLSVQYAVAQAGWTYFECNAHELTEPALLARIRALTPQLLVYSGYGGQIVPRALLDIVAVLHIHSGTLPHYRGSTTLYYELLAEGRCAASAILLDESIDTGPILQVAHYPAPPANIDVDYLYDNQIRADLLVNVLRYRHVHGRLPTGTAQAVAMPAYYIIHPVLKHLALMAVDAAGRDHVES